MSACTHVESSSVFLQSARQLLTAVASFVGSTWLCWYSGKDSSKSVTGSEDSHFKLPSKRLKCSMHVLLLTRISVSY